MIDAVRAMTIRREAPMGRGRIPTRVVADGGKLPARGYQYDAGLDLYVAKTTAIPPGEFRDIRTGIAVNLPDSLWGLITGRSSTIRKRSLLVTQGVIDPGYQGELFSAVWNLGTATQTVSAGDRIAQLILFPNVTAQFDFELVSEFEPSERGERGFGSTGA